MASHAAGQSGPLRGVVWQPPADLAQAISDLYAMRRAGVQAVRTGVVGDERLLTVADTLGLRFFQEIPITNMTAGDLRDTVGYAARLLEPVLARAKRHRSARFFGLARMSDTSDPAACDYFQQLTRRVHTHGPAGARSFYVSPYTRPDACVGVADLVLLNVLDHPDPARVLDRWASGDSSGSAHVGIGALGTWVDDNQTGLRAPHSPEAQARYLESNLNLLLGQRPAARPFAVFVYRWRDPAEQGGVDGDTEQPVPVAYGLSTPTRMRPSMNVVSGIYTGDQTVFAFDGGEENAPSWPWTTVLGWCGVILLGTFYAASPRLRFMVPRYFGAHGFYRDAVREGRDVLLGVNAALLTIIGLTTGVVWAVVLRAFSAERSYAMLLRWLSEPARELLAAMAEHMWAAALVFGGIYALSALLWSVILALASRRHYPLAVSQTLMLIVWPRWPVLLLLPAAMVVPYLSHDTAMLVGLLLLACWAVITIVTTIRTAYDFNEVTRVPFYFSILCWLINPMILLLALVAVLMLANLPETRFLYHLLEWA